MKRLALLLLFAASAWGAPPTIGNCFVDAGDRSMRLLCILSVGHANYKFRILYDYDQVSLDRAIRIGASGGSTSTVRNMRIGGLTPDTDVFFSPIVTDTDGTTWTSPLTCPVNCTNCTSSDNALFADNNALGEGHSGISCVSGELMRFHTKVLDTCADGPPCKPTAPSHAGLTSAPAITGTSSTVAAGCTNYQALLDARAAAAAGGGTVEEIKIPANEVCRPENETTPRDRYDYPNACPGMVVVRSAADLKLLPPAGAMQLKFFKPHLGKIGLNVSDMTDLRVSQNEFDGGSGSGCWYFENIAQVAPDLDEWTPLTLAVTDINPSTEFVSVADASALANEDIVVVNLTGTGVRNGYGPMRVCSKSGNTFQLAEGTSCGAGAKNLVGTYGAGGVIRRWPVALPISAISDTTPVELTITAHGIGNYPDMTIDSGTGATVTVSGTPGEYQIGTGTTVYVQGTGNGSCDGIRSASVSGSVLTLSGASCGGVSAGTVRRLRAFVVFGTSDDDLGGEYGKTSYFDVTGTDTIELLQSAAQGTVAEPGWITWEPELMGSAFSRVDDSQTLASLTFDRVLLDYSFPYRASSPFNIPTVNKFQIINSWIEGQRWHLTDPVTGNLQTLISNQFDFPTWLTRSSDVQVRNTAWLPQPFLFADTTGGASNLDMTIEGNVLWNPEAVVNKAVGLYYRQTFCIEIKSCERCVIRGNHLKGCRVDFAGAGNAISLQNVGSSSGSIDATIQDVEVAFNSVERSSGFLQISEFNTQESRRRIRTTERIWVHDNLIARLDSQRYTEVADSSQASPLLMVWDVVEDLIFTRNTAHIERQARPQLMDCVNQRGSGVAITKNFFVTSEGGNSTQIGVTSQLPGSNTELPAPVETDGSAAFAECFTRGVAADPLSTFSDNKIIPGLESSPSGVYATKASSTDTADTKCVHELIADPTMTTFTGLDFIGTTDEPCNESLNTRLDLAFEPGGFVPAAAYAGYGAGQGDAFEDAAYHVGPVTLSGDNDQINAAFHAAQALACSMTIAPWNTDLATSFASAGAISRFNGSDAQSQNISAVSLSPATRYVLYIAGGGCRRAQWGDVTTAGSP
jgi:hypothetical protein